MTNNENGEERNTLNSNTLSRKMIVIAAVVLLIGGFALGTLFGSVVDVAGVFGNGDEKEIVEDNGFESARPHLEQQLREEREAEILTQHLEDLKEESEIETFLEEVDEDDEDTTIAVVNDEEIKMEELMQEEEQQKQTMMMQGMDPESEEMKELLEQQRPQILDNLITIAIVRQKVEEEEISVKEEEIEERYQEFAQQLGGEEMLKEQLEEAGMTQEEFRKDIHDQLSLQLYIENYLDEHLDEEALDFSEEELREMYETQQQMQQPQMEMEMD